MTLAERIATLEEAISSGARKIVFHSGGTRREIEYQSLDAMRSALADLKAQALPKRTNIILSAN